MSYRKSCTRAPAAVLVIFLTAIAGLWPAQVVADEGGGFLIGIEDLPLMPLLSESADGGMVFDTPGGRIVDAFASGTVTQAEVMEFYAATLPQLGWTMEAALRFRREGEILKLEFTKNLLLPNREAALTVRFAIFPDQNTGNRE